MKEKKSLDKVTILNLKELLKNKEQKGKREKVKAFEETALKCPHACWKKEELKISVFWCNEINKGCHISRCPLLKINKSL